MVGKSWNKISLTGCKYSNSNAPKVRKPGPSSTFGSFPFAFPFSHFQPLLSPLLLLFEEIRNKTPQYKGQDGEKILEQNQLNRLLMVQFKLPKVPVYHSLLGESLFPFPAPPCCFLSSSLWGNKELDSPSGRPIAEIEPKPPKISA